jgi:hypothetical protein
MNLKRKLGGRRGIFCESKYRLCMITGSETWLAGTGNAWIPSVCAAVPPTLIPSLVY